MAMYHDKVAVAHLPSLCPLLSGGATRDPRQPSPPRVLSGTRRSLQARWSIPRQPLRSSSSSPPSQQRQALAQSCPCALTSLKREHTFGRGIHKRLPLLLPVPRGRTSTPVSSSSGPGMGSEGAQEQPQSQSGDVVELPLFPLPLVLFPGSILPLQIFEYRYRIMMHTLLQTDLRFGIVFTGKERGTAAAVGCVGQIVRHERLPDDRFFVICKGEERFRVMDVVRTRPYLVGRVSWLEDRPSAEPSLGVGGEKQEGQDQSQGLEGGSEQPLTSDLDTLANEVASIMSNVIRLTRKVKGPQGMQSKEGAVQDETAPLDLRKSSFPTPFSFWVASTFEGAPLEQQALLELVDTKERLERERETLRNTLNYLTAAVAVRDAFPSSSSDSSNSP